MKVAILRDSTSRYSLLTIYMTFLNILNIDVAKGVLEASMVEILKVVVKQVNPYLRLFRPIVTAAL